MATITHVSSPATGAVAVHALLTLLCAAGWEVQMWSDATTYEDETASPLTANPFGSGASGAGNLGNTSAWIRMSAPDGSREWLFQRGSSDAAWTINRSAAGFVGGSPAATTLPTATDATALFSAASAFSATPGRLFLSADDSDDYGWRLMCCPVGGGNVLTLIADEPLSSPDPADVDPYVWVGYYNSTGLSVYGALVFNNISSSAQVYKRFVGAGSNQRVAFVIGATNAGSVSPPDVVQGGYLPSSGYDVPLPIPVLRTGTPSTTTGWCGFASGIRWAAMQGRTNGQTLDGTTEYWIYAAGLWLRWDSSTPTLA